MNTLIKTELLDDKVMQVEKIHKAQYNAVLIVDATNPRLKYYCTAIEPSDMDSHQLKRIVQSKFNKYVALLSDADLQALPRLYR